MWPWQNRHSRKNKIVMVSLVVKQLDRFECYETNLLNYIISLNECISGVGHNFHAVLKQNSFINSESGTVAY
jgi:hypothetical protein